MNVNLDRASSVGKAAWVGALGAAEE